MPTYKVPVEDMKFLLNDFLNVQSLTEYPGFESLDADTIDAVLQGAAKVAEEKLAPANLAGDSEGCTLENGIVRTPSGYREAYDAWREGGWNAVGAPEEFGGMGLPGILSMCVTEIGVSANHALSMYFGLTGAAYAAILGTAPQEMKEKYAPKMISGEWCGTMNLTEPHCGTDLKLMRTKAVPQDDGTYRITGTKIFISGGDHDLAENIVHMVIAKVPDEDGKLADDLSTVNFFLVPKYIVNDDGSLGDHNGVTVGSIEKKMGIKGSATCVLNYENSVAWKLGGEPKVTKDADGKEKKSSSAGMAGMFMMMNMARMGVGMQGMAVAEAAYQNAVAYTKDRIAGRSLTGTKNPELPADPIMVHPDVRRMLLTSRSFIEGARALTYWANMKTSEARAKGGEDAAEMANIVMLMTPVIKAFFTDMGFESTNMSMQCFGGHGYVHEHGMEQYVRDSRILPIYEGANGVQALDLVGRKLPMNGGKTIMAYFGMIQKFIDENKDDEGLKAFTGPLQDGLNDLQTATMWFMEKGAENRDHVGASSAEYLRMFGIVTLGFMWGEMVKTANAKLAAGEGNADFMKAKQITGRHWMERLLPETTSLLTKVKAGSDTMMAMPADMF